VKKTSLYELKSKGRLNFLDATFDIGPLLRGGLHFYKPGEKSHAKEERHVHPDHYEVFVNVQGMGILEIEGREYDFNVGDVFLIEPGESHHLTADKESPVVNLWMGAEKKPG